MSQKQFLLVLTYRRIVSPVVKLTKFNFISYRLVFFSLESAQTSVSYFSALCAALNLFIYAKYILSRKMKTVIEKQVVKYIVG